MIRTSVIELHDSYTFEDYDGEPVTVQAEGEYDVSTIPARAGTETVLFRLTGTGPRQIELRHWDGHPSEARVRELLAAGRFHALGL